MYKKQLELVLDFFSVDVDAILIFSSMEEHIILLVSVWIYIDLSVKGLPSGLLHFACPPQIQTQRIKHL
jgi:hypothetical protein